MRTNRGHVLVMRLKTVTVPAKLTQLLRNLESSAQQRQTNNRGAPINGGERQNQNADSPVEGGRAKARKSAAPKRKSATEATTGKLRTKSF